MRDRKRSLAWTNVLRLARRLARFVVVCVNCACVHGLHVLVQATISPFNHIDVKL